ncbi:MAG: hypothetical protein P4L82_01630 [Ancalomicrobiaceae bacterium]|nr:hypothetical protein [Ancalomicrobiaceae bacterium]
MADYYAILKRAISGLAEPTGEARRSVYEKARSALVQQLKSFDPPLTASEITQQRLQLEDAIRKVESEAAKGLLSQALSRVASLDRLQHGVTEQRPAAEAKPPEIRPSETAHTDPKPAVLPPASEHSGPRMTDTPPPPARNEMRPPTGEPGEKTGATKSPLGSLRTGTTQPPERTGATERTPERTGATERMAERTGATERTPERTGTTAPPAVDRPRADTLWGNGGPTRPPMTPPMAPPTATGRTRASSDTMPPPVDEFTRGPATGERTSATGGLKRRSSLEIARLGATAGDGSGGLESVTQPVQTAALKKAVDDIDKLGVATSASAKRARDALSVTQQPLDDELSTGGRRERQRGRARADNNRRGTARRDDAETAPEQRERSSRWPLVIGLVVAAAVVALGGAAIYLQRDVIAAYIGVQKERISAATTHHPSTEKSVVKSTDRLLPDEGPGKTTTPGGVKVVTTQPISPGPDAAAPNGPGGQSEVAPSSTGQTPPAASPAAQPPNATTQPSDPVAQSSAPPTPVTPGEVPPIVQKATLLEEAADGGTQPVTTQGKVIWQTVKEPSNQPDKPMVTRLKARVEIPDRGIVVLLSMEPNTDTSLQASYMLKLEFKVPPDFKDKGVARVPGIIMRATEQSRGGDPLAGATAKVPNGMFWIALYADDASKARNVLLMKDRGWIDIPIVYDTNRRAMLSLEKAGAGDRVFSDAFAAWSSGG